MINILKVWWKLLHGFSLWNTHKVYARRRRRHRCPDSAGYDYNPSLGAGVKNGKKNFKMENPGAKKDWLSPMKKYLVNMAADTTTCTSSYLIPAIPAPTVTALYL